MISAPKVPRRRSDEGDTRISVIARGSRPFDLRDETRDDVSISAMNDEELRDDDVEFGNRVAKCKEREFNLTLNFIQTTIIERILSPRFALALASLLVLALLLCLLPALCSSKV